jgi:hypothetical protein
VSWIGRDVEDVGEHHLTASKVSGITLFSLKCLSVRGRDDFSLYQLLNGNNVPLSVDLLGFEDPIEPLPQFAQDLRPRLFFFLGKGRQPIQALFKIHKQNPGFKGPRVPGNEAPGLGRPTNGRGRDAFYKTLESSTP